jgi:hypothetical protein
MRKRGPIFILAAIPAWGYFLHDLHEARKTIFGYEYGSAAMPFPPLVRALGWLAIIFTLIGLGLLASDLARWIRQRFYERAS